MRSLISALFIVGLLLSPALAEGPCTEIVTPVNKRVSQLTKGFEPVVLILKVPVAEDKDVQAEARKAFVRFWIAGRDSTLRTDVQRAIDTIHVCHFLYKRGGTMESIDKTYLRVRMLVVDDQNRPDAYFLRAGIYLPKALVKRKPFVESEAEDGTLYRGTWEKADYTAEKPVPVKRKKGKVAIQTRTQKMTLTQLVLSPQ
jgi:hypothetical protein